MPLELKTEKRDHVAIIHCAGRLVFGEETAALRTQVKQVLAEQPRVVLEMSAVKDVDSGGVGVLIGLFTSARGAGGDLKLVAPSAKVRHTLVITRLIGVLSVYERIEDAIAAFS